MASNAPVTSTAVGYLPNSSVVADYVELDSDGHIVTYDDTTATSCPGIFAAGDVAERRYRQAITAAGTGCRAAVDAERWLQVRGLA
jgi:thioredoxin reductase (NADPH)